MLTLVTKGMYFSFMGQFHVGVPAKKLFPSMWWVKSFICGSFISSISRRQNDAYVGGTVHFLLKDIGLEVIHIHICCISLGRNSNKLP